MSDRKRAREDGGGRCKLIKTHRRTVEVFLDLSRETLLFDSEMFLVWFVSFSFL